MSEATSFGSIHSELTGVLYIFISEGQGFGFQILFLRIHHLFMIL